MRLRFTSHFNGNTKNTIRFIFAIQRYHDVSNFINPNTLFNAVYNNVHDHIKIRFAQHKAETLQQQHAALPNDANTDQQARAAIYSLRSMQRFFMDHYRPSITRSNIFRYLKEIRMRYNENPRVVLDRTCTAIRHAMKTIELYNAAGVGIQLDRIRPADRTAILTNVFCTKNNSSYEKNQGGINALVQKMVRQKELQYTANDKYTIWYAEMDSICAKVGGMHYAGDPAYKYVHYEPQILELWDSGRSRPKPTRRPPNKSTKRKHPYPRSPYQPKPKQPRQDPNTQRSPTNPQYNPNQNTNNRPSPPCYRCGRTGHKAIDCYSKSDINRQRLHHNDRRQLNQMPFRNHQHKPRSPTKPIRKSPRGFNNPTSNSHSFQTKNDPRSSRKSSTPWAKYPPTSTQPSYTNPTYTNTSYTNNPSHTNTHRRPQSHPNPNQPQIHALLAQIKSNVEQNVHADPSLLENIQSLESLMNPDNSAMGHDPQ